jgi:hypothetical protein
VADIIGSIAQGNDNSLHILQEFGSLLIFTGLITLWFVGHYDASGFFHWAMTTFWALFALVHWFDVRGSFGSVLGALINTVPLGLFLAVGLLREKSAGKARPR